MIKRELDSVKIYNKFIIKNDEVDKINLIYSVLRRLEKNKIEISHKYSYLLLDHKQEKIMWLY